MIIGIDARFVGPEGTGLGKYTEKLITNLAKIDSRNKYFIYLRKSNWSYLSLPGKNFTKVEADIPWYSLTEQLKLPKIFKSNNLDLLHVPHFNVPIFYKGKFMVTIHDLIHHEFQETSATSKNPIIFKFKRFAYKKVISHAIKKSKKIIVPSKYIKRQIVEQFAVKPDKIVVTYEAAEEEYFRVESPVSRVKGDSIIYVGNVYPHKNVNKLLDAMKMIKNVELTIVCPRDIFAQRLKDEIKSRNLEKRVKMTGYLAAEDLSKLFSKSTAYVFPTLSEGFGIPGLNAMAAKLPVICSNIPVLKEVYGDAALYFDPKDPKDIATKIRKVLASESVRDDLIEKGRTQAKKYSWSKMAKETLQVYSY